MSENAEITNVKIVLIGESGVGKTCIVSRFVSDMFDANSPSTDGASYAAKTIYFEEHKVNLQMQLWDTSGKWNYACKFYNNYKKEITGNCHLNLQSHVLKLNNNLSKKFRIPRPNYGF